MNENLRRGALCSPLNCLSMIILRSVAQQGTKCQLFVVVNSLGSNFNITRLQHLSPARAMLRHCVNDMLKAYNGWRMADSLIVARRIFKVCILARDGTRCRGPHLQ